MDQEKPAWTQDELAMELSGAICRGVYKDVELWIERGADVNRRGYDGYTPLIEAATVGDEDTARLLLQKGANPRAVTSKGDTALRIAWGLGHEAVMRVLASDEKVDALLQRVFPIRLFSGDNKR